MYSFNQNIANLYSSLSCGQQGYIFPMLTPTEICVKWQLSKDDLYPFKESPSYLPSSTWGTGLGAPEKEKCTLHT